MTVEEACDFFRSLPSIYNKLSTLNEVGLGYIKLGQSATTLSGGEAQRVKLATELSKRSTGRTFYILDEPTTGLHSYDVEKLVKILLHFRDGGNTVLVIEHNLDVIKVADWLVDLGPEGGDGGRNHPLLRLPRTGRRLRTLLHGTVPQKNPLRPPCPKCGACVMAMSELRRVRRHRVGAVDAGA